MGKAAKIILEKDVGFVEILPGIAGFGTVYGRFHKRLPESFEEFKAHALKVKAAGP